MTVIPVYEWLLPDGKSFGCGTALEFEHWTEQGVNPEGSTLGKVLTHENPVFDEHRRKQWERAA